MHSQGKFIIISKTLLYKKLFLKDIKSRSLAKLSYAIKVFYLYKASSNTSAISYQQSQQFNSIGLANRKKISKNFFIQ